MRDYFFIFNFVILCMSHQWCREKSNLGYTWQKKFNNYFLLSIIVVFFFCFFIKFNKILITRKIALNELSIGDIKNNIKIVIEFIFKNIF
jgi:hypothetical protein